MQEKLLQEYAKMAVGAGVNIQKGQNLIINAQVHTAFFARLCAIEAYKLGAKEVVVHYQDEELSKIKLENTKEDVLCDVKPWLLRSYLDYLEDEKGAAILSIASSNPEIYKGLDINKIRNVSIAQRKALQPYRDYMSQEKAQWCIVAIPSNAWAKKVFSNLSEEEAVKELWEAIFKVSRVEGDSIKNWKEHSKHQEVRKDKLNELDLVELHFTSQNGTDLKVGLGEDCVWAGVSEKTVTGVEYIPNMPTEELFTAPHKDRVNGIVYGTKPYVYSGNIIEDFVLTFKDGKVVEYDAKVGKDLLGQLLSTDEGANRIGEVALVPKSSPINKENILFYNTLFDENAACHIAFGKGYASTIKNGPKMTKEELANKGLNDSLIHDDVMIGSSDMSIVGLTKKGEKITIFENGDWAI